MTTEPLQSRWLVVAAAILAGVFAAVQVGIVPPVLPVIRREFGLGLVEAGWVSSTLNLLGATCGLFAGLVADRFNPAHCVAGALAFVVAGAALGALAGDYSLLLLSRVLSGIGLLGVAVAAPRVIALATTGADLRRALGTWSIYMPSGIVLAMAASMVLADSHGWRALWWVDAAAVAIFIAVFLKLTGGLATGTRISATAHRGIFSAIRSPGPWLLGGCFCCYALLFFAVTSWFPTYLVEEFGFSIRNAAVATALVALVNIAGNLGGTRALSLGIERARLIMLTFGFMLVTGTILFAAPMAAPFKVLFAVLFTGVGGAIPAAILSGAGLHAGSADRVGSVNGMLVQGSHVGILSGAPVMAAAVSMGGGWQAGAWVVAAFAIIGIGLALMVATVEHRISRAAQ